MIHRTLTLAPGTRLGAYEITAQIGAGGMGEVYRATDTNLKRAVAIKVLPESVGADRDRLARLRREAEVLASLNHSNIASIYGLERSDAVTALVMEMVEGPTLADRIAQGPIALDEAVWHRAGAVLRVARRRYHAGRRGAGRLLDGDDAVSSRQGGVCGSFRLSRSKLRRLAGRAAIPHAQAGRERSERATTPNYCRAALRRRAETPRAVEVTEPSITH